MSFKLAFFVTVLSSISLAFAAPMPQAGGAPDINSIIASLRSGSSHCLCMFGVLTTDRLGLLLLFLVFSRLLQYMPRQCRREFSPVVRHRSTQQSSTGSSKRKLFLKSAFV
ncbi:hypothetical protein BC629DRAFT_1540512 [Irpex lacteus]|nr:hypothetical protein BC629DRAFT_1540512 [Irpex lacteus]